MGGLRDLPMGFVDPVSDAQVAFRAALRALSHPGEVVECPVQAPAVPGLMPATVALLLALTDLETPVWWARVGPPARWLQFHTGAPTVARPVEAHFAVVGAALDLPDLNSLSAGTNLSPEQSATLLMELPSLTGGAATEWSGPGLRTSRVVQLAGLPDSFWAQWQANHGAFPSGVDVLFVHGSQLLGLPRTTMVQQTAGCR